MSQLASKFLRLIDLVAWRNDAPLHVVKDFDQLTYSIRGDIESQEQWLHDAVKALYVVADWENDDGPFDEPSAVAVARKLLAPLGITGPVNLNGDTND